MGYQSTNIHEPYNTAQLLHLTAECVSSYLFKNRIDTKELPNLIQRVYGSFVEIALIEANNLKEPAVPIDQSVTDDYLICLEDGQKLKMLKRYLKRIYDMSPDEYRARWNLSRDYPMVAPNYASKRSAIAKSVGLGTRNSKTLRRSKAA